ncbi:TRAP transporter substrate-binding protein [Ahrensia sp. R2A130]|uniref:TRAP transporter substrate-binding protein n=1 Tax=Ahrensia sp. R2A130 TaxID=744979 RepID=UPI0001E0F127|nr:TRAP transporter substrate-binding protein [Ahrensia sp. R2A130]EFL87509.1 trap dicarboxylate transporter- dctp subunit [Ahrensia sp. R2A130]
MTDLSKRKFLRSAGIGAAGVAAATTLATPALSQNKVQMRFVTTFPKMFPGLGTSARRLTDRINLATDGRVEVKLYDRGALVPGGVGVFDAVAAGNADMYYSSEYYHPSKSQAYNIYGAVPFGMTTPEVYAWLQYGGGQELWDELHAGFNMKPFAGPSTGVQMGGWFNKPIKSLDDMRGVKFRMPGIGGEVLRSVGVAVVNLPGSEVFAALQSGAIDGAEWVGPWHDLAFGFHKVVKHYHWPGFHEPGNIGSYGINLDFWKTVSDADKQIITGLMEAECHVQTAEYNGASPPALDKLLTEHGVQLHQYPDEVLLELAKASRDVMENLAAGDEMTGRVWESYKAFRKQSMVWSKLGIQGFLNAREMTEEALKG